MQERSRAAEQARVAARAVLANLETLIVGGLGEPERPRVVTLATELSESGGHGGARLDASTTRAMVEQLAALLRPQRGLTGRAVVAWFEEALASDSSDHGAAGNRVDRRHVSRVVCSRAAAPDPPLSISGEGTAASAAE